MDLNFIIELFQKEFSELESSDRVQIFLFGSILITPDYNDIDILFVYNNSNDIKVLQIIVEKLNFLPLDVNYYTLDEVIEFNFFNNWKYIKIL
ncbi:nucleotidyltransferase domain-containing protein [Chryseobacterium sp. Chry.R1]|uniref:nucleotidyltransferase domain-containing protein n=1 Tax=Chryseobacterium sp. Chry.R1 TaxID=3139392 RepID=UPI0031F7FA23